MLNTFIINQANGWLAIGTESISTELNGNYLAFFGSHIMILGLVILVAIDIITGFWAAALLKEVSSKVSFWGMWKKTAIFMLIAAAFVIERTLPDIPLVYGLSGLFCFTEFISIIENLKKIGVPIPGALDVFANRAKDFVEKQLVELLTKAAAGLLQAIVSGSTTAAAQQTQPPPVAAAAVVPVVIDYDELARRVKDLNSDKSSSAKKTDDGNAYENRDY